MDRLPIELVENIIHFIESISSLLDRQHALSVLSRTSKTYNALLSHKLYLRPVLTSEKRVELWSRTYWARSNPWNLCDPKKSFKEVIVPVSLSLTCEESSQNSIEVRPIYRRRDPPLDTARLLSSPFAAHFVRNLTSITVSSGFPTPSFLLAGLLGISGMIRSSITSLVLQGDDQRKLVLFILEATNHFDFIWSEGTAKDVLPKIPYESISTDDAFDEDKFRVELYKIAQNDYSIFEGLSLVDEYRPAGYDHYYDFEHRGWCSNPFAKLESLTLEFETNAETLLLFRGDSLPRLTYLKLIGEWRSTERLDDDIDMWRYAIAYGGEIDLPDVDDAVVAEWPGLFVEGWAEAMEEEEAESFEYYVGVDLFTLDLSECMIVYY